MLQIYFEIARDTNESNASCFSSRCTVDSKALCVQYYEDYGGRRWYKSSGINDLSHKLFFRIQMKVLLIDFEARIHDGWFGGVEVRI